MLRTLSLAILLSIPVASLAQTKSTVRFQPGNYGTMVSGTITGDEYMDYLISAKAGQNMFAELTVADSTGNGTVYFNILPPGSNDVAIYNSSVNGNTTTSPLPSSGTYTIRVYHMGNDEDSGATSGFNLDLSIQ